MTAEISGVKMGRSRWFQFQRRVSKGGVVTARTDRIVFTASVLSMLLVAGTAVLFALDGLFGSDPVSNALILAAIGSYVVVGGSIARRLPRNACGWLLMLIGAGLAGGLFTDALSTIAVREHRDTIAAWAMFVNAWLLPATVLPGIVLYLVVFPTGRPPSPRWRPLLIGVLALAVAGVVVSTVQPFEVAGIENPFAIGAIASATSTLLVAILFGFIGAAAMGVTSVVVRFRSAPAPERQQLRWLAVVALASLMLLVGSISFGALGLHQIGDPLGVVFLLMLILGLPLSAYVALRRHHLYGIEVVANRSLVYGSLAALITATYAVIVAGAGALVGGGGDRSNVLAAVASTVVAALVFQPARRRAQRLADRLIYGDRASPYELVSTFTERLDAASLNDVLPQMAELVAQGTGAQAVRIWLRSGVALRAAAGWPADTRQSSPVPLDHDELPKLLEGAFPIRHRGHLLGAITVEMPPQEPMTPVTEQLIGDLSAQAGLVLRNVSLVEELQLSRQRLVSSQDEERRRLERDLHDGAQQRLVALSVELRMARTQATASGDAELSTRLDTAADELAQSLAELRELARGIHPAILTQNGLGAALRSLAERSSVPVELRCVPEGRFVPEVEATTYFLVSEALANVAKHAGASQAFVAVRRGADRLDIEVTDDGNGGASMNGGSGLRGLADRVGAVGGRMNVRSQPGAGTTVHAEIPCV